MFFKVIKDGETIAIGGNVLMSVIRAGGGRVHLKFDAPADIRIRNVENEPDRRRDEEKAWQSRRT